MCSEIGKKWTVNRSYTKFGENITIKKIFNLNCTLTLPILEATRLDSLTLDSPPASYSTSRAIIRFKKINAISAINYRSDKHCFCPHGERYSSLSQAPLKNLKIAS